MWGTANRQHHLYETKFFRCRCARCLDPTEMNTEFSSLRCPSCSIERYGNTGCGVLRSGLQNPIDFCLKVKCSNGFFDTFWKEIMASRQNFWPIWLILYFWTWNSITGIVILEGPDIWPRLNPLTTPSPGSVMSAKRLSPLSTSVP